MVFPKPYDRGIDECYDAAKVVMERIGSFINGFVRLFGSLMVCLRLGDF